MTIHDGNQWPAQEPPADFADRVVKAMLQQSAGRSRRVKRQWLVVAALAAAFLGSAAWAAMRLAEQASNPGEPQIVVPSTAPEPEPAHAPPLHLPTPEPPAIASSAAPKTPRPPQAAISSATAPAPSAEPPPKKVRVPRCECAPSDLICTCVE